MNVTKPDIEALYGEESERARKRYAHLQEKFTEEFGEAELRYFSAPGRTEIIGNHTDHNGGQILAGSITLDTICAAAPTDDGIITIVSEGYQGVDPLVARKHAGILQQYLFYYALTHKERFTPRKERGQEK